MTPNQPKDNQCEKHECYPQYQGGMHLRKCECGLDSMPQPKDNQCFHGINTNESCDRCLRFVCVSAGKNIANGNGGTCIGFSTTSSPNSNDRENLLILARDTGGREPTAEDKEFYQALDSLLSSELQRERERLIQELEDKKQKKGWMPLGKSDDPWNKALDTAIEVIKQDTKNI